MISEEAIIQNLRPFSKGFIGDDAAVLPHAGRSQYVVSKDLLVQDVHFRSTYFSPEDLAHKALHVNLSDLAAMGANPLYALCGISIPQNLSEYSKNFLDHLAQSCEKEGVILIGGDTTGSGEKLFISLTAIGTLQDGRAKRRDTAQKDDLICVAGHLGWALLGLTALENSSHVNPKYTAAFLRPTAKTKEGAWLAQQPGVTSMMDLSDGLYVDLRRLCKASGYGATVHLDAFDYDSSFKDSCEKLQLKPIETTLTGGEDYSLLFTCHKEAFDELSGQFTKTFQYDLVVIGSITTGSSALFYRNGQRVDLDRAPFTHFGEAL